MCADQPATRAQPNIAGVRSGGISAMSRTTAAQYSTFVSSWRSGDRSRSTVERHLLERRRHLDARRAELLRRALAARVARGSYGAVDAMAEAHDPLAAVEQVPDVRLGSSPASATASIIGSTRAGAPPCSGPESVPTAADIAAAQSAPVEAAIRAVNVEALRPCSAAEIQ